MIEKFACAEIKKMVQHHSFILNEWASKHNGMGVSQEDTDTLLSVVARLYELIEQLPLIKSKGKLNA
jgi:hypothetical protein